MKPRDKRAVCVLVFVLVLHIGWQWHSSRYAHPSNVRNIVLDMRSSDEARRMEAKNTLLEMGTNAAPHLWQLYVTTNQGGPVGIGRWFQTGNPRRRNPESKERRIGYEGLMALGPAAASVSSNLVHELVREPKEGGRATSLLISIGPAALPAIAPALSSSPPLVKEMLLNVVGHYRSGATPVTLDIIAAIHGSDARVRRAAASALAQVQGFPSLSVPALVTMLRDTNAENREMAMHALSVFGTNANAAVPELHRLVSAIPRDHSERVAAAALLIAMREVDEARAEVMNLLESTNPTNRLWALTNLTEVPVPFPEIGRIAARFLGDSDTAVRFHSAQELGQAARATGYPEELINAGLGASSADLRLAFLQTAYRPDVSMLPLTIRALGNDDARVCRAAAVSLTGQDFSTRPAQPALAALLNHADQSVRRDAYHALHNSDFRLFPMLVPWPLNTPTERTVNTLVRLYLLGPSAVTDTNQFVTVVGRLPQPFAPLAGAVTTIGRMNLIPSLKTMLALRQEIGPCDAADTLVELSPRYTEARVAVLELLLSAATPRASVDGLRMALGFQRSSNMPIWLELAERADPDLRREALLRIGGPPSGGVEKVIPILLKAARDSDRRVSDLATGLLRHYPAELVDKHRHAAPPAQR